MKVALIGLGHRIAHVTRHLLQADPRLQLAGWADPAPEGLLALTRAGNPTGSGFDDAKAMLAALQPDLVLIGSPNHLHLQHIELALDSGARVLSEKPVVRTVEESETLARRLAFEPAHRLLVGLVMRSAPVVKQVRSLMQAGRLGRLVSMEAHELLEPSHGGFLMRDWRRRGEWVGSYLLDKCCHDFDLFGWLIGAVPARVASFGGRGVFGHPMPPHDAERARALHTRWPAGWSATDSLDAADADVFDHQVAIVEYANGVKLAFHTNSHAARSQRRWLLAGTSSTMSVDLYGGTVEIFDNFDTNRAPELFRCETGLPEDHFGADPAMGVDLASHWLDGGPPLASAREALVAGLTVMAIDEAARTGTVVDCAPMLERLVQAGAGPTRIG